MSEKTDEELIEEFIENGGKIEKLPPAEQEEENVQTIGSVSKKTPELMTLAEGELMFGEKRRKNKKSKKEELPYIDIELIPEHLHHIVKDNK